MQVLQVLHIVRRLHGDHLLPSTRRQPSCRARADAQDTNFRQTAQSTGRLKQLTSILLCALWPHVCLGLLFTRVGTNGAAMCWAGFPFLSSFLHCDGCLFVSPKNPLQREVQGGFSQLVNNLKSPFLKQKERRDFLPFSNLSSPQMTRLLAIVSSPFALLVCAPTVAYPIEYPCSQIAGSRCIAIVSSSSLLPF